VSGMQRLRPGGEVKVEKFDEGAPAGSSAAEKKGTPRPPGNPSASPAGAKDMPSTAQAAPGGETPTPATADAGVPAGTGGHEAASSRPLVPPMPIRPPDRGARNSSPSHRRR